MGVCFLQGLSYSEFLKTQVPESFPAKSSMHGKDDRTPRRLRVLHDRTKTRTAHRLRRTGRHRDRRRAEPGDRRMRRRPFCRRLTVREFCAADPQRLTDSQTVRVKIRGVGRNPRVTRASGIDGQSLLVELREPAWAPAKDSPSFSTTATCRRRRHPRRLPAVKRSVKRKPDRSGHFYALRSPGLKIFGKLAPLNPHRARCATFTA